MDPDHVILKMQPGVYTFLNIGEGKNMDLNQKIKRWKENHEDPPVSYDLPPTAYGVVPEKRNIRMFRQTWLVQEAPSEDTEETTYTIMNLMSGLYFAAIHDTPRPIMTFHGTPRVQGDEKQLFVFYQTETDNVIRMKNVKVQMYITLPDTGEPRNGVYGLPDNPKDERQRWKYSFISKSPDGIREDLNLNAAFTGSVPSFNYGALPYVVIPEETRDIIWGLAKKELPKAARAGVCDADTFAWTLKNRVATWAENNLEGNGYAVAYGVAYLTHRNGDFQAINWYLSSDLQKILLFDPIKGREIDLLEGSQVTVAFF